MTKGLGENAEELQRISQPANRQIENPPPPLESWFELDVALNIASQGYRIIPQYPVVSNKRIDIVIQDNERRLAVECDGDYWHGPEQYEKDMERQRMLERCGWRFHRIRESAFYANHESTLKKLWQDLDLYRIKPIF